MESRAAQDEIIRYLTDPKLRRAGSPELHLEIEEAAKAERFARFLARRYYRDRLQRSFKYSPHVVSGARANAIVESTAFDAIIGEEVSGSLAAAQRVGALAVDHL